MRTVKPNSGGILKRVLLLALIAVLPVPAEAVAAPYEPNDNIGQATAISGGGSYSGTVETVNDEDWFVFYTSGQRQIQIDATGVTGGECSFVLVGFHDAQGDSITSTGLDNENWTYSYTTARASRYYLVLQGQYGAGCSYEFSIQPGDALTTKQCFTALTLQKLRSSDARKLERKVRRARSRTVRRRYTRQLRRVRKLLKSAQRTVDASC